MSSLKERMAEMEGAGSRRSGFAARASVIPSVDIAEGGDRSVLRTQRFREFDASRLRPWKYHNRHRSWLDRDEQRALEASIRVSGQHTLGLVRAVAGEADIDGETVFGYRRAQACLAVGAPFQARVVPADAPDTLCMQLMHSENAQSEDVSELENARVYRRLLTDGVYPTQTTLARSLGVSQAYVSRLAAAASIYDHEWLLPVIEPMLPEISVRMAAALVSVLQDPERQQTIRRAVRRIVEDDRQLSAPALMKTLLDARPRSRAERRRTVLCKRGRSAVAVLESDAQGNLLVQVKAHEQTPAEREDLVIRIARALDAQLGAEPARAHDAWKNWRPRARTLEACIEMFVHNVADVLSVSWHDYRQMTQAMQRSWLAGVISSCGCSAMLAAGKQSPDLKAWQRMSLRRDDMVASLWGQLHALQTQTETEGGRYLRGRAHAAADRSGVGRGAATGLRSRDEGGGNLGATSLSMHDPRRSSRAITVVIAHTEYAPCHRGTGPVGKRGSSRKESSCAGGAGPARRSCDPAGVRDLAALSRSSAICITACALESSG